MGTEVIAARTMNMLYIWLDIGFLLILAGILVYTRKYAALVVGLLAGILYWIVDYGGFYLLLGTRHVDGADPFWFLLWMSMSYGFTNFVWIWLWLEKDSRRLEWSVLILSGWLCTTLLSQNFGAGSGLITISRGTASYHGVMALLLFVGYAILCVQNIREKDPKKRAPLGELLAIGILVQFGWEFMLLITGIRPQGVLPLIVNSLLETNLGMPYIYWIYKAWEKRRSPGRQLSRVSKERGKA